MTQRKPPGVSWESFVEQRIQAAQEAGEFDNLPGFGEPLPDFGDPTDELWWLKQKVRREELNLIPPALLIRLDVEKTLRLIDSLTKESEVRHTLAALNERIRRANLAAVWGPPSTTQPLDVERVVEDWRSSSRPSTPSS